MEHVTGSSGTGGAWAARLAAPQRRPLPAVSASREMWNTAYPGEAYDVDLVAVAAAGAAGAAAGRNADPNSPPPPLPQLSPPQPRKVLAPLA